MGRGDADQFGLGVELDPHINPEAFVIHWNGGGPNRAARVLPIFPDSRDLRPRLRRPLFVPRLNAFIEIDGDLGDPAWVHAARATNFTEYFPGDGAQPPVNMETLVTYDDTHLYLAFMVEDDPKSIRASLRDRDEIWSDDYAVILLHTYGDANWAYFIFANPLGVQGDSRFVSGTGEDDGIDLAYESEGQITDKGYQVEMAIPFSSLRFPGTSSSAVIGEATWVWESST